MVMTEKGSDRHSVNRVKKCTPFAILEWLIVHYRTLSTIWPIIRPGTSMKDSLILS